MIVVAVVVGGGGGGDCGDGGGVAVDKEVKGVGEVIGIKNMSRYNVELGDRSKGMQKCFE